jgi:ATP/maltotriose-dependent transcriptional regulator MalT
MKIITSKITIPAETPLVCRQGLLDALRENPESCHATVINGRAGTGKTMLAVDFIRRHVGIAAWYTVNAPDMSLPVFYRVFGGECGSCATRIRTSDSGLPGAIIWDRRG